MPIDTDKYSRTAFERLGRNTPAAKQLAAALQSEIETTLDTVVRPAFMEIVAALRAAGHELQTVDDSSSPTLSLQAVHVLAPSTWALNIGYDLVVSTGYPDTSREDGY